MFEISSFIFLWIVFGSHRNLFFVILFLLSQRTFLKGNFSSKKKTKERKKKHKDHGFWMREYKWLLAQAHKHTEIRARANHQYKRTISITNITVFVHLHFSIRFERVQSHSWPWAPFSFRLFRLLSSLLLFYVDMTLCTAHRQAKRANVFFVGNNNMRANISQISAHWHLHAQRTQTVMLVVRVNKVYELCV